MSGSAVHLGMLGFGTVGQAVARALVRRADDIARRTGHPIRLARIAVRDAARPRAGWPEGARLHTDPVELVEQADVQVVIEVMGGEEPALSAIRRALALGKPVVTANKLVMARHGATLLAMAHDHGVPLLFEAAVGGAIPIIRPIRESLASDRILGLAGILNGTTNFILTEMEESGTGFGEALERARSLGYAEADPQADLSGWDAAYKLAVLASIAFGGWLLPEAIHVTGLNGIEGRDIQYARELGLVVKLLASASSKDGRVEAWVGPALLARHHPLSQVRSVNNAILLSTEAAGELMFYGPGAGGDPTAAAVLGDVMDVASKGAGVREPNGGLVPPAGRRVEATDPGSMVSRFYIRMQVLDRPGVLAAIAAVFGQFAVSIESVIQKGRGSEPVDLVFVTHEAPYSAVRKVVSEVSRLPVVVDAGVPMRVVATP
ncbi:homoserine dehydrogenase [Carboxydochorda subterranea]|uniref:Homoserine dehydrogenase n=1 Tax=Carboxydichorda subterranea TaxID=3109565 RepID=A0ABZ1C0D2_9FIRM|nr:homoserine dehydrogenase [Limnochorda sp. L945t]WRP18549.1 homoserine dehydrogenase [Limnochorda sp. L945t]